MSTAGPTARKRPPTAGAIGAGLNEWDSCQKLAEASDLDCFLLAGRYTLLEQESLQTFLPLCQKRGIGLFMGGPYNTGILATAALQFPLAHPAICSVIPGAKTAAEVKRNIATIEAPIPKDFWSELKREKLIADEAPLPA